MHEKYLWPFVSQEVITSLLTETENMITKSHHTWNNIIWWTNSKWWQGRHNSCIKHRNLINLSIITDTNCCLVTPSQALMSNSKNCVVRGQFVTWLPIEMFSSLLTLLLFVAILLRAWWLRNSHQSIVPVWSLSICLNLNKKFTD